MSGNNLSTNIINFIPESENNNILKHVVQATFPNLNIQHQRLLQGYIICLIQYIAVCFDFYSDSPNFRKKLEQNRYKDCRWLLTYLLPHIETDTKTFSEIRDLNDIYTSVIENTNTNTNPNPNLKSDLQNIIARDKKLFKDMEEVSYSSPRYVFSNIQYSRFDKSSGFYKKIKFEQEHIDHNFKILLKTIKDIRYKMHINWIDIIPIRMDNFKENRLYKDTMIKIKDRQLVDWDPVSDFPLDKVQDNNNINRFYKKVSGMNIGDIYDTISVDIYESIVQYKWLIFDVYLNRESNIVPVIYGLDILFDLPKMLENKYYKELSEVDKNSFNNMFDLLRKSYNKSEPLTAYQNNKTSYATKIEGKSVEIIVNAIVMFYDQKYSKIKDNKYVRLSKEISKDNIEDYDNTRSYDKTQITASLNSIDYESVYDFIVEALEGFSSTWFGTKLLDKEKKRLKNVQLGYNYEKYTDTNNNTNIYITFKNVYNFCKSLVHYTKSQRNGSLKIDYLEDKDSTEVYTRYPRLWNGMDENAKIEFTSRINGIKDPESWFNIFWNIFYPMKMIDDKITPTGDVRASIVKAMRSIQEVLKMKIIEIVFETMISKGVMTEMVCKDSDILLTSELYDTSIDSNKAALVKTISDKYFSNNSKYMTECYYYLTDKPYYTVPKYTVEVDKKKILLDYMVAQSTTSLAQYVNTAYNWIAQIGFCHKFINNRVNFMTGATGSGKSTEIPKLYLYYLKSIDRINDGTVVVTVPRRNVAESVSGYISKQMALPYKVFIGDEVVRSDNYTVQFKHSGDSHVKVGRFPKIRFVTDGSVIEDIKDPMLRSKRARKNKEGEISYVYGRTDLYNVLLVDEAHEHNANMDLILSIAKNAAFYNNRFRLGIVSATILEDEPVYRRFYRDINDNRKYPIDTWLMKHNLDRINTERRFHISPPDVSTRFKIDEYYKPGSDPITIVQEILSKSTSGEILVFQPGANEIKDLVLKLNAEGVMPPDTIAIPYYAKMPSLKQDIVKNIDYEINNIKIGKGDDFVGSNLSEGVNNYKRAIIVSTNISEASITYPSLKYVVETGVEKTGVYDYKKRTTVIKSSYITEASRIQRRGRVGRKSAGTVYYTYEKGAMELNRKQFNISIQDSHYSIFLELLKNNADLPIFTDTVVDIVTGAYEKKLYYDIVKEIRKSYYDLSNKYDRKFVDSIIELLTEMYMPNGYYNDYVGKMYADTTIDKTYNKNNRDKTNIYNFPYRVYFSGYDHYQLTDPKGTFYIVHPDELDINRNINGDVVSCISEPGDIELINYKIDLSKPEIQQKFMKSRKIKTFWSTLLDSKYCTIDSINNSGYQILKTKIGTIMKYCVSKLSKVKGMDEYQELAKVIVMAYGLTEDRDNDMYNLNILIDTICYLVIADLKPRNIFVPDPILVQRAVSLSKKTGKDIKPSGKNVLERTKNIFKPTEKIGQSDLSVIIQVVQLLDKISQNTKYGDIDILNEIGINMNSYSRYINLRKDIRDVFQNIMIDKDNEFKKYTGLDKFSEMRVIMSENRILMSRHGIDLIRASLLLCFPYSIVKKIQNTKYHYISAYSPELSSIYTIGSTSRNYYYPDTYVDLEYLQNYVHYLNCNTDTGDISTLTEIRNKDILLVLDIYRDNKFEIDVTNKEEIKIYTDKIKYRHYESEIKSVVDESDELYAISESKKTVANIKNDILNLKSDSSINTDIQNRSDKLEEIIWAITLGQSL